MSRTGSRTRFLFNHPWVVVSPLVISAFAFACDWPAGLVCPADLQFTAIDSVSVQVGASVDLKPEAFGCGGKDKLSVDVRWTGTDPTIARVSESGRVTGVKRGTAYADGVDRSRYGIGPYHVRIDVR
jgi:hypothetical protein